jgi:hypothetical protein
MSELNSIYALADDPVSPEKTQLVVELSPYVTS